MKPCRGFDSGSNPDLGASIFSFNQQNGIVINSIIKIIINIIFIDDMGTHTIIYGNF